MKRPLNNKESLPPHKKRALSRSILFKTNSILTGNNMLDITGFNIYGFLKGMDVILNSPEFTYLEQTVPTSTLRTSDARSIPFKTTDFSHGNNMLASADFSIDGFFGETHVFLHLS
jgi:hypothetical protein